MNHPFHTAALVVTSISGPSCPALRALAEGAQEHGVRFIVIGDSKSPAQFDLPGCEFHSLESQRALPFAYARLCPEKSYARKNIGYLLAFAAGAQFIVETDDDNFPLAEFWVDRNAQVAGGIVEREGWLNAYGYFSSTAIYPRGFPIELAASSIGALPPRVETAGAHCPIQQGLADRNPDVDAIYRMLLPLPVDFDRAAPLILGRKTWCPFNSQNTTTFREAAALLYLPATCSMRMTDIWRGFVAQRIAWTCGWSVSFHSSTVHQERNEHDLLRDFADEVPGYLHNAKIARALDALDLQPGPQSIAANMRRCYAELIAMGLIESREMELLDAWLADLDGAGVKSA